MNQEIDEARKELAKVFGEKFMSKEYPTKPPEEKEFPIGTTIVR